MPNKRSTLAKEMPSAEFLRGRFYYMPWSGQLQWKQRPDAFDPNGKRASRNRVRIMDGKPAGSIRDTGHIAINIGGRLFMAHRIIMAMNGNQLGPYDVVDHINGDPSDNRLCNLRVTSQRNNMMNMRRRNGRSSSGYIGVSKYGNAGMYRAVVGGSAVTGFTDPVDAAIVRDKMAIRSRGEFANLNFKRSMYIFVAGPKS